VKQSPVLGATDLSHLAKPAALLFDKLFSHEERAKELGIPGEITFYYPEVIDSMLGQIDWEAAQETLSFMLNPPPQSEAWMDNAHGVSLRRIWRGHAKHGIKVVPLYRSEAAFSAEFNSGEGTAYQAVLNNIPVVAAQELEWRQILEFRQDPDALRKYRALRVWMQEALVSKSLPEATDLIGLKLDDYEWALRKHGLKSVIGTISEVLDSKTIAAATAAGGLMAVFSQPLWALLTAGSLIMSKVAVSVAERSIEAEDLRRGENAAIATIYEIQRIASGD
jgi:hypothetical protein